MPPTPNKMLAILTCMDARIDPLALLGLEVGDAHVIRNAGGVVTEDVLSALETSRNIGTKDVAVIAHKDCGLGPGEEQRVRDAVAELKGSAAGAGRVTGYIFDPFSGDLQKIV